MAYYNEHLFRKEGLTFPDVVNNSLVSEYKACPLKAFYKHILKIRPKTTSVHLNAGRAYSDAMDVFRQAYYGEEKLDFESARARAVCALIESYGDYEPEDKYANKAWDRVVGALLYYFHRYPPDQDILRPATINGKPASEFSFAEPLHENLVHPETGDPILYTGRFDSIMEMGSEHNLYGYDDKTTSRLGATWADKWGLHSQFMGYRWGAARYGIDLQGTIVRGISILKTRHETAQAIIQTPKWMMERWYQSTCYTITCMINDFNNGYWNSILDAYGTCESFGGCEFKMLCESDDPEPWIEPYYETNLWNPLTGEDDVEENQEK